MLRSGSAILVIIWKWPTLLNSVPFIKKTLVNHVYIRIWSFWLTFTVLQWKIWLSLKLLNSFPLIKKTLVSHLYIWIWSFLLTFTALQWMKTNLKISQFPRFLLRSEYAIQVKIWKWLTVLNSVPFNKKTHVNQLYIPIWSFWLTFTVLQSMKENSKISQCSSFLLRSRYAI